MNSRMFLRALYLQAIAALLLVMCPYGRAQSDVGSISGFVRDKSGAVIPNAKVTIRNEGTNQAFTVTTDSDGHYTVPNLPPATYSMEIEATGFSKFVSTHNPLAASTALAIDGA